jgi:hypothetical protein
VIVPRSLELGLFANSIPFKRRQKRAFRRFVTVRGRHYTLH